MLTKSNKKHLPYYITIINCFILTIMAISSIIMYDIFIESKSGSLITFIIPIIFILMTYLISSMITPLMTLGYISKEIQGINQDDLDNFKLEKFKDTKLYIKKLEYDTSIIDKFIGSKYSNNTVVMSTLSILTVVALGILGTNIYLSEEPENHKIACILISALFGIGMVALNCMIIKASDAISISSGRIHGLSIASNSVSQDRILIGDQIAVLDDKIDLIMAHISAIEKNTKEGNKNEHGESKELSDGKIS